MAGAESIIRQLLDEFGLTNQPSGQGSTILAWAMNLLRAGATPDQVNAELRGTPGYRERFAAIFEREKRGLPPISPAQVLDYERRRAGIARQWGLPRGFYDSPQDAVRDLVNDVSITEFESRVAGGFARLQSADPALLAEFKRQNNLDDGQIAAFFLDPNRALPIIEQAVTAAEIGTSAITSGFGEINAGTAQQFARQGVTADEAQQGFEQLRRLEPVTESAVSGDPLSRAQQLSAIFGDNPDDRIELERRIGARAAIGQSSSGSFAADREGFAGVGAAQ